MSFEVQQSMFEEANRMELAEQQSKYRKEAFRAAFDFLEKHDPPVNTEEYWVQFAKDVAEVAEAHKKNELCQKLLEAVVMYLDEKQKVLNDLAIQNGYNS